MSIREIDRCHATGDPINILRVSRRTLKARAVLLALAIAAICFGVGGCATDGYVGVSTYPDYSPYYGYYGYGGAPYYGYGGIYTRRVVVGGRRYSGGYGRHHVWRDRRGHNWHRRHSR